MYFMYSITYTMHDISYWGMVPALSSDANARNQFTSRATLFAGIGGALAGMLIPIFTTGKNAIGGSTATAYGVVALTIAILAPAFLCFTIFGVRERRDDLREAAPPISLKKIFSTFTHNDQLMWIALIFLIQQIGNGIVVGGLGSTYIYFDFGYEGGLYSLFSTVGLAATGFLMIFYPAISRRIKRKKLMMISIINTVEYNELLTGNRDEAIIASLRPFTTKLASALTVAITSASYLIFGVTGFTNKISALEQSCSLGAITEADKLSQIDAVLAGVQHGQTAGLLLCMTVLPCALMFVSYLLYIKKYRLDEEEYERICVELQVREAQQ